MAVKSVTSFGSSATVSIPAGNYVYRVSLGRGKDGGSGDAAMVKDGHATCTLEVTCNGHSVTVPGVSQTSGNQFLDWANASGCRTHNSSTTYINFESWAKDSVTTGHNQTVYQGTRSSWSSYTGSRWTNYNLGSQTAATNAYLSRTKSAGSYTGTWKGYIFYTAIPPSACGAPTSVTLTKDGTGKLKVTWSGASAGRMNAISSYHVILSTSSGGSAAFSATVTSTSTSGSHTFTVNNMTTYYAGVRTQGAAGSSYYSGYKWSSGLAADYLTACGAPTSVTLSYIGDGKLRVSWSGASGGTNNSISSYHVILSTSSGGSAAYSATVTTTATSGTHDFTLNNTTTYYAGVRTQGSAGSSYYSGYKWSSGAAAKGPHPTVSVGSVITKVQMDTLKTYKNKGTAATVGNTITKALADTYATAGAVGTTIPASWYNNA